MSKTENNQGEIRVGDVVVVLRDEAEVSGAVSRLNEDGSFSVRCDKGFLHGVRLEELKAD